MNATLNLSSFRQFFSLKQLAQHNDFSSQETRVNENTSFSLEKFLGRKFRWKIQIRHFFFLGEVQITCTLFSAKNVAMILSIFKWVIFHFSSTARKVLWLFWRQLAIILGRTVALWGQTNRNPRTNTKTVATHSLRHPSQQMLRNPHQGQPSAAQVLLVKSNSARLLEFNTWPTNFGYPPNPTVWATRWMYLRCQYVRPR